MLVWLIVGGQGLTKNIFHSTYKLCPWWSGARGSFQLKLAHFNIVHHIGADC